MNALDDFSSSGERGELIISDLALSFKKSFQFFRGSVCDRETCELATRGVDAVIHLAANGAVNSAASNAVGALTSNVYGLLQIARAAKLNGCRHLVFASSCAVYGDGPVPAEEHQPLYPSSLYAWTKLIGEELLLELANESFSCIALRYFNVYGPGQRYDGSYAAVIPLWLRACLKGESIVVHGDGCQTRDFCFIDDVVHATIKAASISGTRPFETINIGSGRPLSLLRLTDQVRQATSKATGRPCTVGMHLEGRAPSGIRHSACSPHRMESVLGFCPQVSLDDGLYQTALWVKENVNCESSVQEKRV